MAGPLDDMNEIEIDDLINRDSDGDLYDNDREN
jgi:hypothetical protein